MLMLFNEGRRTGRLGNNFSNNYDLVLTVNNKNVLIISKTNVTYLEKEYILSNEDGFEIYAILKSNLLNIKNIVDVNIDETISNLLELNIDGEIIRKRFYTRSIYGQFIKNLNEKIIQIVTKNFQDSTLDIIFSEELPKEKEVLKKYLINSEDYIKFETIFSSELGELHKVNNNSFKIGNMLILFSNCPSEFELSNYSNIWLKDNSLEIINDKSKEYKINGIRVIEKQVKSSNIERVFKFICINNTMIMFTYGALFSSYSDIVNLAIANIKIKE